MSTITTHLTAEQFEQQYADVPFRELVRGEVIELMPGGLYHSRISRQAYYQVQSWARQSRLGRAYTNETGLITERGPDTVRGADVAYFSFHRLPPDREPTGFSEIAADLVIEVVGKGQGWNAMLEKGSEYLTMGVSRVWILDPQFETLHVLRRDAGPLELSGDDIVADEAILPGFSCRVSDFFQDITPASSNE